MQKRIIEHYLIGNTNVYLNKNKSLAEWDKFILLYKEQEQEWMSLKGWWSLHEKTKLRVNLIKGLISHWAKRVYAQGVLYVVRNSNDVNIERGYQSIYVEHIV